MIRAIIFDCFGVLVHDSWLSFKEAYFHDYPDKYDKAGELNYLSNTGKISYEEFLREIADLSGLDLERARRLIDNNPPNLQILDYIRDTLKPAYKIGMLSNAADDWLSDFFTPEELALFDVSILSYKYSCAKPDPRIFTVTAQQLGVSPEECIFVDDIEKNCYGAQEVGMRTIWYQEFDQMKRELEVLLTGANN